MSWLDNDVLYPLRFTSTYVTTECGAESSVIVGFMSLATVSTYFVWMVLWVVVAVHKDFYLYANQGAMGMLTCIQFALLMLVRGKPPVVGCGPTYAWPSTQVLVSAYISSWVLCVHRDLKRLRLGLVALAISGNSFMVCSALFIGYADPTSVIVATVIGTTMACVTHELMQLRKVAPRLDQVLKWMVARVYGGDVPDIIIAALPRMFLDFPVSQEVAQSLRKEPEAIVVPYATPIALDELSFGRPVVPA